MQMKFNTKKCKVMHIGKNNTKAQYFMHKDDGTLYQLEETEVEKDLGVYTDDQLKFADHCKNKVNTANRTLQYVRHTFKFIDENIFKLLYTTLI